MAKIIRFPGSNNELARPDESRSQRLLGCFPDDRSATKLWNATLAGYARGAWDWLRRRSAR